MRKIYDSRAQLEEIEVKGQTHLENEEFVSIECAKSSSVWAAGIRSVFIKYGFVVSRSDLQRDNIH